MKLSNQKYFKILISDLILLIVSLWFWFIIPEKLFNDPTSFVLEASNGALLSASIAKDGQWRFPASDTIPLKFIKCITAFEDKRFFTHIGVDPFAIGRATLQNIKGKKVVSGASTLTMQVIRLSRKKERTWWQKAYELLSAIRLEIKFSKIEILNIYASNAPFGSNVVGIDAAAWRYFGESPETLSWGEMATLAVLPNSPSLVNPGRNALRLILKRNNLLDKLVQLHYIDEITGSLAKLEPIPGKPLPLPQYAPHLLNRFKGEKSILKTNTTRIRTTIDYNLQIYMNLLLKKYQNRYRSNDINNIAALVLNARNGTVLSYTGNIYQPDNTNLESHVDMIKAPRSPGSTLKPLLYASMLNDGFILPHTLIPDIPTQIAGYTPQNYDLGYDGAIPADKALSRSLNIPAVKMLQTCKYQRFYDKLKRFGFSSMNQPADHYGLSLILGGSEVTMWDLSSAYLGMVRTLNHYNDYRGKYNPDDYNAPVYIKDKNEQKFRDNNLRINSILDYGAIWNTFNAMEELMRPGEEGLWEQFNSSQRIAWKTGTSFGFRDGWAIGLTPDYIVCIWVGNADGEGRPNLTGIDVAAPVLFDVFRKLPAGNWFQTPKNKLIKMQVCKQSGYKAGEYCIDRLEELVPPAGEKTKICPFHQLIHLDPAGKYQVTDECQSTSEMIHKSWFVLPPAMEYYYMIRNSDYKPLPDFKVGCGQPFGDHSMEMLYPKNNASMYIPIEINGTRGKLIFNATHRNPNAIIYWHIDEEYLGSTKGFHQMALNAKPGKHQVILVDQNGERLIQTFEILKQDSNNL
jgi:penicillin-binding protein 1C